MQLVKETLTPVAATQEHPLRVDSGYERAGKAAVFLFCEPLGGCRQASVRVRRTKLDWAREVVALLEGRCSACDTVTPVGDNPNPTRLGCSARHSLRSEPGAGASSRIPLHAGTRQLTQRRRKRAAGNDAPRLGPPTHRRIDDLDTLRPRRPFGPPA